MAQYRQVTNEAVWVWSGISRRFQSSFKGSCIFSGGGKYTYTIVLIGTVNRKVATEGGCPRVVGTKKSLKSAKSERILWKMRIICPPNPLRSCKNSLLSLLKATGRSVVAFQFAVEAEVKAETSVPLGDARRLRLLPTSRPRSLAEVTSRLIFATANQSPISR